MARSITRIPARTENETIEECNGIEQIRKKKVAAYCRVSTDQDQQLNSFEAQRTYYTQLILSNPDYEMAGIYADEGISGTNTKKRDQFNTMIKDCKEGKIDIVLCKSISRFARNTLDCLNYVRELKNLGIAIIFEKENINTLDAAGEVLLTILSSLAQDESRSISENSTWGIRRSFEQGKVKINEKRFLGYEKDSKGNLVIDRKQAAIVKRIYSDFLAGKGTGHIAADLTKEKVRGINGATKWYESTIRSILKNEKYKGDALLQKSYTVDFLTKKRVKNEGEVTQYYVEENHPAIIDPEVWEVVQLEFERRRVYCEKYNIKKFDTRMPFLGKVICGKCGATYGRQTWMQPSGVSRKVWRCSRRIIAKGVKGCDTGNIREEALKKAFVDAYNTLVDNKEILLRQADGKVIIQRYRTKVLLELIDNRGKLLECDDNIVRAILAYIIVKDPGRLEINLLDGTVLECEI